MLLKVLFKKNKMEKKYLLTVVAIFSFLIYSCGGASNQGGASNNPAAKVSGDAIYKKTCISCHQPNGEGLTNVYPPLAKSDFLNDKEKAIGQVIKGYTGELIVNAKKYNSSMPAQQLTDEEIAAVLTYVYGNFGNSGGAVTADDVKAARAKL